jgi:2-polyprenyl-3-methyl-5-hydroxy-6-metoxy-1,4-benzoquinol methylase
MNPGRGNSILPIEPTIRKALRPLEVLISTTYRRMFVILDSLFVLKQSWAPAARTLEDGCAGGELMERLPRAYPLATLTARPLPSLESAGSLRQHPGWRGEGDRSIMAKPACVLCDSSSTIFLTACTDFLLRTTRNSFSLFKCQDCGTVFIWPLPPEEELPSYYPSGYWWSETTSSQNWLSHLRKRLESAYRRLVLRDHVQFVLKTFRNASAGCHGPITLLDVGCSGGTLLHELSRRGLRVKGLDFSKEAVTHARQAYQLDCAVGDLNHFPWKDETFSILTCFHVLEHVARPRVFLRAARSHLTEQGFLVLQVPNLGSWQFRLLGVHWHGLDPPRHLVNFSEYTLIRLFEQEGFEVTRRKHFSLRDDAAAWVTSLFPSLDPFARAVRGMPCASGRPESPLLEILKNFLYFLLLLLALPFAVLDSICGGGATIMVEAKRRPGTS